jgi:endoplasmic reticulum junction formation protein lunapark
MSGLARKEDFAFITYYCPHCNALNGPRQHDDQELVSNSGKESPSSRSDGSVGPNYGKENPRSYSDSGIGHAVANLISSSVADPVVSNLRTTAEVPAEDSVEKASTNQPVN